MSNKNYVTLAIGFVKSKAGLRALRALRAVRDGMYISINEHTLRALARRGFIKLKVTIHRFPHRGPTVSAKTVEASITDAGRAALDEMTRQSDRLPT